jgi:hypothetical protein
MRKVLHEERLECGWERWNEGQEMPQEMMYAVVDGAAGEGRGGALWKTSFEGLQTRLLKFPEQDHIRS